MRGEVWGGAAWRTSRSSAKKNPTCSITAVQRPALELTLPTYNWIKLCSDSCACKIPSGDVLLPWGRPVAACVMSSESPPSIGRLWAYHAGRYQAAPGKQQGEPGWGCAFSKEVCKGSLWHHPLESWFSHIVLEQAAVQTSGYVCCHSLCDFHKPFKPEAVVSIVGGRGGRKVGRKVVLRKNLEFFCQLTFFSCGQNYWVFIIWIFLRMSCCCGEAKQLWKMKQQYPIFYQKGRKKLILPNHCFQKPLPR